MELTPALLRDAAREALIAGAFFLPLDRRKRLDRWLRGREEMRRIEGADMVCVSFGKSGRTWLRVMLSRFFQVRLGLPATAMLEFDNLHKRDARAPKVYFSHGNYVRDYTGAWKSVAPFGNARVVLLIRDPRDVAVSQYFQWRFRMRAWKKVLNEYPATEESLSVFDFLMRAEGGLLPRVVDFLEIWEAGRDQVRELLVVRYEDMRADAERELRRILEFMGQEPTAAEIQEAVAFGSLENMRRLEEQGSKGFLGRRMKPGSADNPQSFKTRRGKVGGWRDYVSEAEEAEIEAFMRARPRPPFGYGAAAPDPALDSTASSPA